MARIINFVEKEKCIVALEDGTYCFWPTENIGAYTARDLRHIAAYLDAKNTAALDHLLGLTESEGDGQPQKEK